MIIDAHHHFWMYNPEEYGWIGENMGTLRRDFLPPHLQRVAEKNAVTGVVSVQARQKLEETEWLLELAEDYELINGVVGWLPLRQDDVEARLERFAVHPKLKGVRHVVHDEADDEFILDTAFNHGVSLLQNYQLVYDILIFERHLPQTIAFVDRHPNQTFVLDHIGKPRIADEHMEPWSSNLRELAQRSNVACKLSGMVTEADFRNWTDAQLRPYMETVVEAFGPERVMFGSDWPVCLAAASYGRWLRVVREFISHFSPDEQNRILHGTATDFYQL
ncbi:MAG: amidohydrolase family protein [Candidatus Pacebacteria bacterium]|nr:amidohydrolase family protein [Candidatus Paceibacterota bacterium]